MALKSARPRGDGRQVSYRDIYDKTPVALFGVGVDGMICRLNDAAERMVWRTRGELVGKSVLSLHPRGSGLARARELLGRFRRGEPVRDELIEIQRADGSLLLGSLTVSAIRNRGGGIVESVSTVLAVTGQVGGRGRPEQRNSTTPRSSGEDETLLVGPAGIVMDLRGHQVFVGQQPIQLTVKEFLLLQVLLERGRQVLSADMLALAVCGHETFGERNFLEAHISRLRTKLRNAGAEDIIRTIVGVGYVVRPNTAEPPGAGARAERRTPPQEHVGLGRRFPPQEPTPKRPASPERTTGGSAV